MRNNSEASRQLCQRHHLVAVAVALEPLEACHCAHNSLVAHSEALAHSRQLHNQLHLSILNFHPLRLLHHKRHLANLLAARTVVEPILVRN
jgi:hypothetical protein